MAGRPEINNRKELVSNTEGPDSLESAICPAVNANELKKKKKKEGI